MLSIIMAAHNEEVILKKKLDSIFASEYPSDKIELVIGTDCCEDSTDEIISSYKIKHPEINHIVFKERSGKIRIVNQLVQKANNEILVLTDANVLFSKNTLFELAKHFKNKQIGLVDSHMKHYGLSETGISFPEQSYITGGSTKRCRRETIRKHDGTLWRLFCDEEKFILRSPNKLSR